MNVAAPHFARFRCDVAQAHSEQVAADEVKAVHTTAKTEKVARLLRAHTKTDNTHTSYLAPRDVTITRTENTMGS